MCLRDGVDQIYWHTYSIDSKPGTPEGDELEILGILVDKYESTHYPVDFPDPIEAIKFRMEQLGYNQADLVNVIGF